MADKTYAPYEINDNDADTVKQYKNDYNRIIAIPEAQRSKKDKNALSFYSTALPTQKNVAQNSTVIQRPNASNRDVSFNSKDLMVQDVVKAGNKVDALKLERKSDNPEILAKQKQAIKDAEKELENVTKIASEDLQKYPLTTDKRETIPPVNGNKAEEKKEEQQRKLNYNSLYSYYKSGGFGDPSSGDAKRDFGFAILDTLGSGISNAGRGIKGQASEKGKWENVLAQGKQQEFTLEQMREMLKNNKELQSQSNELRKDFEKWVTQNGVTWGSDKEQMKALKEYMAARGNSIAAGGTLDMLLKGSQIALPLIMGLTMTSDARCKKDIVNLTKK